MEETKNTGRTLRRSRIARPAGNAPAARPPPAAPADGKISIDDFMKVELRTAKVLTAEKVPELAQADQAERRCRERAAHAGRWHCRSLRARRAGRPHGRHGVQPEAGQVDGDRIERHGAGGQSGRRQADARRIRSGDRTRHQGEMIDSHCHLAGEEFAADLDAVVARARAAGVSARSASFRPAIR